MLAWIRYGNRNRKWSGENITKPCWKYLLVYVSAAYVLFACLHIYWHRKLKSIIRGFSTLCTTTTNQINIIIQTYFASSHLYPFFSWDDSFICRPLLSMKVVLNDCTTLFYWQDEVSWSLVCSWSNTTKLGFIPHLQTNVYIRVCRAASSQHLIFGSLSHLTANRFVKSS